MSIQVGKHDMNKLNITIFDEVIAHYDMPSAMPIMAFTAFANVNRCFYLKPNTSIAIAWFINKVGVSLIVIMLIRRAFIH